MHISDGPRELLSGSSAAAERVLLEDLFPNVCVCLFAAWTVCANCIVFLKGTPNQVLVLFGLSIVIGGLVCWWVRSSQCGARTRPQGTSHSASDANIAVEPKTVASASTKWVLVIAAFVAAAGLLLVFALTGHYRLFWWLGVGYFAIAAAQSLKGQAGREVDDDPAARRVLWLIAAGVAVLCLCAHRPDADDCLYLAIGSYTVDNPHLPVMGMDPMRIYANLPLLFAPHKIESLYIGAGVMSYVTGLSVLLILHFIVPAMTAIVGVFAHAKVFKELLPRYWLAGVVALEVILLAMGETQRSYGNFGWVRVHQGKGVFLTVLAPLILVYGIQFGRRPHWRAFSLLAASEIAALGMSSTALWAAPVIGLLATVSGAASVKACVLSGIGAMGASVYHLIIALLLRSELSSGGQLALLNNRTTAEVLMHESFQKVLDWTPLSFVSLWLVMTCWTVAPRGPARRMAAFLPLAFLVFFFNPYAGTWLADQVGTYWRVFWLMPVPVLAAITLASIAGFTRDSTGGKRTFSAIILIGSAIVTIGCLVQQSAFGLPVAAGMVSMVRATVLANLLVSCAAVLVLAIGFLYWVWRTRKVDSKAGAVFVLALLCYFVLLPRQYVLSEDNRVSLGWPGPKVDSGYRPAMWICDRCAAGDVVLAPEQVIVWVPSRPGHPMSLLSQETWDTLLIPHLGAEEVNVRRLLRAYVSVNADSPGVNELSNALGRYPLAAVCFYSLLKQAPEIRHMLAASGYARGYEDAACEVWRRVADR